MNALKALLTATLSATMATTFPALAQTPDQQQAPMMGPDTMSPGMRGWGMHEMTGRGMMGPGMHGMMGQGMMGYGPMMEGRLAYLKAELGITDQQTEAWNGYVSAVKARAATMQNMHTTMAKAMQSGSAVERLQVHTQAMESMAESLKALMPATEALYKGLNEEQKKKADLLLGFGCCMM